MSSIKSSSWLSRVRDPALTALLIVQGLLIFVAAPFTDIGYRGAIVAFEAMVLIYGLLVVLVAQGPISRAVGLIALSLSVVAAVLNLVAPSSGVLILSHVGGLVGAIVVAYVVGRAVLGPGVINAHRVRGAIVLYLNFGIIFANAYRLIWEMDPQTLSGLPADAGTWRVAGSLLYFSFVTLTSIGYGDIVPVHAFVRSLTNLEGIIGQLFPATLLARLITLELEARRG